MKMGGFSVGWYILLVAAAASAQNDNKNFNKKGNVASVDEIYNREWENVLTKYLKDNNDIPTMKSKRYVIEKTLLKALNNSNELFDVNKNSMIDGDNSKKSNISRHENTKKDIVFQLHNYKTENNIHNRQTIDSPVDSYGASIGKAYGDPDNYQAIGDGVFLMNSDSGVGSSSSNNELTAKTKIKTIKESLPDTTKTLTTIIGNLDKEDKDIMDETKKRHANVMQSIAIESDAPTHSDAISAQHNSQQEKVLSSENNIEGVEPKEMNLINNIEKDLKADDKKADLNINAETEAIHRSTAIDLATGQKSLDTIAKAVQDTDKDFIKNNPLVIDPETKEGSLESNEQPEMYKKDFTIRSSDAKKILDRIDAADKQIKTFAGKNVDKYNTGENEYDSERAKNIVDFAAQEDAQIMVGGSRSRRPKKHRSKHSRAKHKKKMWHDLFKHFDNKNEVKKLVPSKPKNRYQSASDDSSADTGFFMADESDLASLNKKTEDFVSHTVNASLVDIIQPSQIDIANKRRNLSSSNEEESPQHMNQVHPFVSNETERASQSSDYKSSHNQYPKTPDKDDINLYKTLNKTDLKRHNRHRSGSVWKVSKKPSKLITVGKKPGVQIDLYITNNKKKRTKKKANVRKHDALKSDMQVIGNQRFIASNSDEEDTTSSLSNDVEDVSLKEAANHQEREMFSVNSNDNEFGSDKTSIDDIQTDHVEGNEGKQSSEVNIQDALNSEEINNAIKQSDLKGLSEMKSEIDLQDEKNTVDFFNQPNTAKSFSHHLDISPNMRELTQQVKEAEAGVENESIKSTNEEDPQKVKIILHIPEGISKQKEKDTNTNTKEAVKSLEEQAKAFLSTDLSNDIKKNQEIKKEKENFNYETLEAAKKIEEFIKQEASKEAAEDKKKEEAQVTGKQDTSIKNDKDEETSENILSAILKSSGTLHDLAPAESTDGDENNNSNEIFKVKENKMLDVEKNKFMEKNAGKALDSLNGLSSSKEHSKFDSILSFANDFNPHPTTPLLEKFIKTTHEQALSKEPMKSSDAVLPSFTDAEVTAPTPSQQLRINGGKVLGGNVRGGNILGGVVSGGDVSGGEIRGGRITGGTFKNGLFLDGTLDNGIVEGGRIKGGKIEGGDIKSGMVDGGIVKGGVIDGGHLIDGSVEGGEFKGGEIIGGHLISGEMDGGVLKNGTINGGVLKGGVIESGTLEGGVMLSGILRGGDVKSGIIKGGIIDKGVIVQDAEIGPGVEIHDGIVKGGKITVNSLPQVTGVQSTMLTSPLVPEADHTDENRSNIMYTLEVLPKPTPKEASNATVGNATAIQQQDEPIKVITNLAPLTNDSDDNHNQEQEKHLLEKSLSVMNNGIEIENHLRNIAKPKESHKEEKHRIKQEEASEVKQSEFPQSKPNILTNQVESGHIMQLISTPKQGRIDVRKQKLTSNRAKARQIVDADNKNIQLLLNQLQTSAKRAPADEFKNRVAASMYAQLEQRKNAQGRLMEEAPLAHWELSKSSNSVIKGEPGVKLRISGGVRLHNGHAILDGINGYMDAGDYQGECFSDPEVCENGFTVQMTLKIYRDSVFNTSRMFIIDSGAWSKDSRGISLYVRDGRIGGIVVTRDETWCLHKILEPYIEKWMTLTVTWEKNKGLFLYINCDEFDKSLPHASSECDQCIDKNGCHKTDVATRLMFGRPNKGPHFKVIHMAVGEISLYERYFDKEDVKKICGSKDDVSTSSALASIIQTPSPMISAPAVAVIQPTEPPKGSVISFAKQRHSNDEDGPYMWPTPPSIKFRKLHDIVKADLKDNLWPTPAHLRPMMQHKSTQAHQTLIDYNTDRRSSLWSKQDDRINGGYSSWTGWSPCSQSCGEGVKIAVRYCSNPIPKRGGKDCSMLGSPRKFTPCSNAPCAVRGERRGTIPVMHLDYGTKKSIVPGNVQSPMIIVNGQQKSLQELETAFEQLKHRRK